MTTSKSAEPIDKRSVEWAFSDALSHIPIHNHLNKAYHDADMYAFVPPRRLRWRIPAIYVPMKVREAVDAEALTSNIKSEIMKARKAVEEIRSVLDQEIEHVVHHSPDCPYPYLHPSVVVEHQTTPGYAPAWSYAYNPYLLAITVLDEYEQFIDIMMRRLYIPFVKLARIHQKAKMLESNTSLVTSQMRFSHVR